MGAARHRKRLLLVGVILLSIAARGYGYYRYRFPYGWSHCCDKILSMALAQYADRHDGWFPRGEASPEASLSLLFKEGGFLDRLPFAGVLE